MKLFLSIILIMAGLLLISMPKSKNMKSYLIGFAAFLLCIQCWQDVVAQSGEVSQYLLKEHVQISGFGGPMLEFSSLEDEIVPSVGAGLALLIEDQFFVGCYGMNTNKSVQKILPEHQEVNMHFMHTGLWIGYIMPSSRMVRAGFNLQIGGGKLTLYEGNSFSYLFEESHKIDEHGLLVLTPEASLEFNFAIWMKATAGVGYRFVSDIDTENFNKNDLMSLRGNFGLFFRLIQSDEMRVDDEKNF